MGLLQHLAQDAGRVGEAGREPAGDELVERGGETRILAFHAIERRQREAVDDAWRFGDDRGGPASPASPG